MPSLGRINKALHALLALGGAGLIGEAAARLNGLAQSTGWAGGLAAIAVAALSWAAHSRRVQEFAHTVAKDIGRLAAPALAGRISAVEHTVEGLAETVVPKSVVDAVAARVSALESKAPAEVKVAAADIEAAVRKVLAEVAGGNQPAA